MHADRVLARRAVLEVTARVLGVAFVGVFLVAHALLAWLSPLVDADWAAPMWDARFTYVGGVRWFGRFVADHWTFSDLATYLLGRLPSLHVVASPVAALALVLGMTTLAFGRVPRLRHGGEMLMVALASTFVWIATTRPGVLYFHRSSTGTHVYAAALATWVLAAYRGAWRPSRAAVIPFVIAAFWAGTSTRQVGIGTAIAAIVLLRRRPPAERPAWMRPATIAVSLGAIAGCFDAPLLELRRVLARGFEQNLNFLINPLSETGKLVSLAALLALAKLTLEHVWPRFAAAPETAPDGGADTLPAPGVTFRLALTAVGLAALSLFGPRATEVTQLPATVVAIIAVLPYYRWLVASRPLRALCVALAVATHVVAWGVGFTTYRALNAEFEARLAAIARTPAGQVAVVAPYAESLPDAYRIGEDWGSAPFRQLLAIDVFGLHDIDFAPAFRTLDPNPHIDIRFESTGVTSAQLAAARAPTRWATQPVAARVQFKDLVDRLEDLGVTGFSARLVVHGIAPATFAGRPILGAWYEQGHLIAPYVTRGNKDEADRIPFSVKGESKALFTEAWILEAGQARRAEPGRYVYIKPITTETQAIVLCTTHRCLLADAISPRF